MISNRTGNQDSVLKRGELHARLIPEPGRSPVMHAKSASPIPAFLETRMKTLRILIADDHDLMRRGVKALLQSHPGWEICGEAHTGREAVRKPRS